MIGARSPGLAPRSGLRARRAEASASGLADRISSGGAIGSRAMAKVFGHNRGLFDGGPAASTLLVAPSLRPSSTPSSKIFAVSLKSNVRHSYHQLWLPRQLALLVLATMLTPCSLALAERPIAEPTQIPTPTAVDKPLPSVVSTNLCADLLLLRLGVPEQILSVSRAAQDPAQSPVAEIAARYPSNQASVEELLYFQPEIALTYIGWSRRLHGDLLEDQGIRVVPLSYPQQIEDALSLTREIAQAIEREAVGAQEIAKAAARIEALSERFPAQRHATRALYLRPNGGTAGSDTYIDSLLALLGLRNLAAEQGIRGWGTVSLEQLILDPPDLLLLGYFDQAQPQSTARYGRHPLMQQLLAKVPSIPVPSSSAWGCGGLELIDAAELIATELEALEPDLARWSKQ